MLRTLFFMLFLTGPLQAEETYDLIFRQGTLSDVPTTEVLQYDRQVQIGADPDYAERNTGRIELNFEPDEMARLRFVKDGKHRVLGNFPATVGNPIIMYFVETVLRDVAKEAGGSPFYIRNRIKESLISNAPIEGAMVSFDGADVEAKQITLRPFKDDKNRDRMGVYADLEMTFTMTNEVPGWYSSLVASTPGTNDTPDYRNALILLPSGDTQ